MSVLIDLRHRLPDLPKKLALATRYALDHPDRVALDSMRNSAVAVGVASPTMLRLARQMGFASYNAFRSALQSELFGTGFGARAGALHDDARSGDDATLARKIVEAVEQNMDQALARLDQKKVVEAATLIRNAPACYLVGSGSLFWLASMMKNTGNMILPNLRLIGAEYAIAAEALGELGPRDVVIGFGISPCAMRTVEAMRHARQQGAHTVAMTDRPSSPIADHAEFVFCAETRSPHYYPSIAALIVLVEVMLATVVAEGTGEEIDRITRLEAHRKSSASYIEY